MQTIITTDSGVDPIEIKYMAPGQLNRNDGKSFRDVLEISSSEVLNQQNNEGYLFKTSAPLLEDYVKLFKSALKEADHIVHLSMSSGISQGSLTASNLVANEISPSNITVIDTLNGATGGTLIDIYANYLVSKNIPYQTIINLLEEFKTNIHTSFFVPNPVGFKRSGRDNSELCLKDKAMVIGAYALKIAGTKFRVDFNDEGNLYTKKTMIGRSDIKAEYWLKSLVNEETIKNYDQSLAVIGTVAEENVLMDQICFYLQKYFAKVVRQDINAVVAAYGSTDLIGLSLIKKRS